MKFRITIPLPDSVRLEPGQLDERSRNQMTLVNTDDQYARPQPIPMEITNDGRHIQYVMDIPDITDIDAVRQLANNMSSGSRCEFLDQEPLP